MIISRTPFRISLFGGGTDYPTWFREHGGSVIGTAIDKYCYISVRRLPPFFEHKSRIVYSQVELVNAVSDIKHPAVRGDPVRAGHQGRSRNPSRRRPPGAFRIRLQQLVYRRAAARAARARQQNDLEARSCP